MLFPPCYPGLIAPNFRSSSQPPHSIHPSRGSNTLFSPCLGPVARDRAGTAAAGNGVLLPADERARI